jgi:hypothetical protein
MFLSRSVDVACTAPVTPVEHPKADALSVGPRQGSVMSSHVLIRPGRGLGHGGCPPAVHNLAGTKRSRIGPKPSVGPCSRCCPCPGTVSAHRRGVGTRPLEPRDPLLREILTRVPRFEPHSGSPNDPNLIEPVGHPYELSSEADERSARPRSRRPLL